MKVRLRGGGVSGSSSAACWSMRQFVCPHSSRQCQQSLVVSSAGYAQAARRGKLVCMSCFSHLVGHQGRSQILSSLDLAHDCLVLQMHGQGGHLLGESLVPERFRGLACFGLPTSDTLTLTNTDNAMGL